VCETNCLKPFAVPDRWDDVTLLAGHEDWRGNGRWDAERITGDGNGNGLYDPGDAYDDANGNGQFDAEPYNALLTGYIPDPYPGNTLSPLGDFGLQIVLKEGDPARAESGHYFAVDLPAINRGAPQGGASAYRAALEGCTSLRNWPGDRLQLETGRMTGPTISGVLALIAKDPAARFDPATKTIVGSSAPENRSPRIVVIPLTDPCFVAKAGRAQVVVNKLVGFFLEEVDDSGTVRGRLLRLNAYAQPCNCTCELRGEWLLNCP
jgi:hypothetical protein